MRAIAAASDLPVVVLDRHAVPTDLAEPAEEDDANRRWPNCRWSRRRPAR
jgi:hypothetical protein